MRISIDKLPATAKDGFFIRVSKKYDSWIAVAPVKETAKTLLCCQVHVAWAKRESDGNYDYVTEVPSDQFFTWQDDVRVYAVRKGEHPKERVVRIPLYN